MMTESERRDPTSKTHANTAPVRVVVRASPASAETVPIIFLIGIGSSVACWLMLAGHLDPPFRYRGELVQVLGLIGGVGLAVFAAALFIAWLKGRSRLIEINESNVHVRTIRGAVDISVHDVVRITTNKDRRLVVVDARGRKYIPVLAPESTDWVSVAAKFNESLDLIRQSEPAQHEAASVHEASSTAACQTDEIGHDVPGPIDPPPGMSSGSGSRRVHESP